MKDEKPENLDEAIKVFKKKKNIGSLLDICILCQTKEDADRLLGIYKKMNPKYAEVNIGYILGYLGDKERMRLYSLFSTCNHPIFGSEFGRSKDPTTREAFEAGKKMGEKIKKQKKECLEDNKIERTFE